MPERKIIKKKKFEGTVMSDKMDKTIVVLVTRTKIHPKYKKQYKVGKKYKVHDEKNAAQRGNKVIFEECRPLSKEKKWRLVEIKTKN